MHACNPPLLLCCGISSLLNSGGHGRETVESTSDSDRLLKICPCKKTGFVETITSYVIALLGIIVHINNNINNNRRGVSDDP
jgi:hypothetical protein